MSFKASKTYSVLANKCPRCHEGSFFVHDNPFHFSGFAKMNDKCAVCGEDFRREPGYYFGAAYVSYGLTVGVACFLFVLLYWLLDLGTWFFFGTLIFIQIACMPVFFRWSRLIWINWFVSFKK